MVLIKKTGKGIYKVDYPRAIGQGLVSAAKDIAGGGAVGGAIGRMARNNPITELGRIMKKPLHPPSYKKGGKVKNTGLAMLHKGEMVVPKNKIKSYSPKMARAGKDIGKPGRNFAKIAISAAKRYGSIKAGNKVAGAMLKKLRNKA